MPHSPRPLVLVEVAPCLAIRTISVGRERRPHRGAGPRTVGRPTAAVALRVQPFSHLPQLMLDRGRAAAGAPLEEMFIVTRRRHHEGKPPPKTDGQAQPVIATAC